MRPDQQLESELPEIRDVSGLLMLLRITADILAQVGGKSSDSLPKTMVRLKVVLHNNTTTASICKCEV